MIIFCSGEKIYDNIIHNGIKEILSGLSVTYDPLFLHPENMNPEYCLTKYGELPNVIVLLDFFDRVKFLRERFKDAKIVTYTLDIHYWDKQMRNLKLTTFQNSDYILGFYNKFKRFFGVNKKIFLMPHVCCTIFQRETINETAMKKIFFYGAVDHHYFYRKEFLTIMKQKYPNLLTEKKHPGYELKTPEDSILATKQTAEELHQHFFAFTTGLFPIFEIKEIESDDYYMAAKVFEIMGNGVLLLCNDHKMRRQLENLGFYRSIHYIHIDKENFDSVISYILDEKNHQALMDIRRNGHYRTLTYFSSSCINKKIDIFLTKLDKGETVEDLVVDAK